jgi:methionine synthase I (cobalamin-dependent)/5,10-methylenetetrahydrofolate reductase
MLKPIAQRWTSDVLLADGAMGTLLLDRAPGTTTCVEKLNLDSPKLVESVHASYIAAGAQIVESNTFAANRLKLAAHELREHLQQINEAGVRLARAAAGDRAYVAGSVGPLGALMHPLGLVDHAEAREVFAEHIAAVAAGRPDLLLLETFGSVEEALLALGAAKALDTDLPVVVSLSVVEDGKTPGGDPLLSALRRLRAAGADGIGVNCAVGPQAVYEALAPIIADIEGPLFVMPNAGYPHRVDDRAVYQSTPEYFRRYARDFVALGATVVGGCCGTTPEHIAAMRPEVEGKQVQPRVRRAPASVDERAPDAKRVLLPAERPLTDFERKLGKEFVTTVEVSPPRGVDYAASLAGAKLLQAAGADAVDISDNPTARLRMSSTALAHLIMRETSLATILHFTCRDRNLLGLQSELLGAAALGVTAILALTGDPSNVGDFPKATSVFDVTSVGLTEIVNALNHGKDHAGTEVGAPTRFRVGVAVNPLARDLDGEFKKFDEKLAAGADFAMTQPIYDIAQIKPFLDRMAALKFPVLVGVLMLRSYKNAEFLHNEVPGMSVPEHVRERMRGAKEQRGEGIAIARDLLLELAQTPGAAGAYIIPQDRYEMAAEVLSQALRARAPA